MFPRTLSPSARGLEDGFAVMVFPQLLFHGLSVLTSCVSGKRIPESPGAVFLYQYLLESATHVVCNIVWEYSASRTHWAPGRVTGPLHDLRLEYQEKKEPLGHSDVQRRCITQSSVGYVCSLHVSLAAKYTDIQCVLEMV